MTRLAFFDTNVLLYADDVSSPEKQEVAISLFSEHIRTGTAVVSLQVLQEYYSAATRKLGIPAETAQRKVDIISRARVVRFDVSDIIAGIELHRLRKVSFWDALIIHAARISGASVLYSEDLATGSAFGTVAVLNPFSKSPEQ